MSRSDCHRGHFALEVLVMGKCDELSKMRGVVVSEDEPLAPVLKMIAISKVHDLSGLNGDRLVQFEERTIGKPQSDS